VAAGFPLVSKHSLFAVSARLAGVYPFTREIQMTHAEQKEKGMFTILVRDMNSCLIHRSERDITVS